jgi:Fe(3+) dicitrate transport protein
VGVAYVGAMRESAGDEPLDETLATDEQFVVDLSGRVLVTGPLSVYGNVRNLLDGRHIVSRRPYGARPNAPRWIQVGAKLAF